MGVPQEAEPAGVGDDVPRKGRARRFREARELKQGFDDGLFREGAGPSPTSRTARRTTTPGTTTTTKPDDDWDEDDPLRMDEGGRQAS